MFDAMVPGAGGCPRCSGFVQDFLDLLHEESLALPTLRCLNCGARRYHGIVLSSPNFRKTCREYEKVEWDEKWIRKLERERVERELLIGEITSGLVEAGQQCRADGRDRKKNDSKIEAAKTLIAKGIRRKEAAHALGISVPTLDRWLRL